MRYYCDTSRLAYTLLLLLPSYIFTHSRFSCFSVGASTGPSQAIGERSLLFVFVGFLSISLFAFVSEFVVVSNLYLSPFLYLVLCWRGLHRLWAGSSRQPEG